MEPRPLNLLRTAGVVAFLSFSFLCVCVGLWFLQGRELWATASQTVAGIGTDAHTALQPVAGVVMQLQSVAGSAGQATDALTKMEGAVTPALSHLAVTEGKLDDAVDLTSHSLNDRCPTPRQVEAGDTRECGTLADANKVLDSSNVTVQRVAVVARSFDQHQSAFYDQEKAASDATLKAVQDFDDLVANPDVKLTVAAVKETAIQGDGIVTDGHTWLHQKLFPTKKKSFVSGFEATGDALKHWMPSLF